MHTHEMPYISYLLNVLHYIACTVLVMLHVTYCGICMCIVYMHVCTT